VYKRCVEKTIYSLNQNKLIQNLVSLRKEANLTQMQLAQRLGREQNFIARTELGERRLDVIEFWEYCKACEADPQKVSQSLFEAFK